MKGTDFKPTPHSIKKSLLQSAIHTTTQLTSIQQTKDKLRDIYDKYLPGTIQIKSEQVEMKEFISDYHNLLQGACNLKLKSTSQKIQLAEKYKILHDLKAKRKQVEQERKKINFVKRNLHRKKDELQQIEKCLAEMNVRIDELTLQELQKLEEIGSDETIRRKCLSCYYQ